MVDPAMSPEAENDLGRIPSEDLSRVDAALRNLGAAGEPGVATVAGRFCGVDEALWMLVGAPRTLDKARMNAEIESDELAPPQYVVVYIPLNEAQVPAYPPDTRFCVCRVLPIRDAPWLVRDMDLG